MLQSLLQFSRLRCPLRRIPPVLSAPRYWRISHRRRPCLIRLPNPHHCPRVISVVLSVWKRARSLVSNVNRSLSTTQRRLVVWERLFFYREYGNINSGFLGCDYNGWYLKLRLVCLWRSHCGGGRCWCNQISSSLPSWTERYFKLVVIVTFEGKIKHFHPFCLIITRVLVERFYVYTFCLFSSSGSLSLSSDEELRYNSRKLYGVVFGSVAVPANFVPSFSPFAVLPHDLFGGVLVLSALSPCVFRCHYLRLQRVRRSSAILWRSVRFVTVPVYGQCVEVSVLIDNDGIRSSFYHVVRTGCPMLQIIEAGCFHAIGS